MRWLFSLTLLLSGCDWHHFHMTNSIPYKGDPARNPVVHVYLAVDGLSPKTVEAVMAKGHFKNWHLAKFVTMFPGTSDASWTRILHTAPIGGYEFEFYDRHEDQIRNTGLVGYLCHAMPNFTSKWNFEPSYYAAFDYRANGYFHTVGAYLDTKANIAESFDNLFVNLEGRAETKDTFSAYLLEIDVLGHMKNPDEVTEGLEILAKRIERFRALHPERKFIFTLLSDHGMDFVPVPKENLVKFDDEMKKVGVEPVTSLSGRDSGDGIYALTTMHTRVTYLEMHTHPDLAATVAQKVSQIPSVDVSISRIEGPKTPQGLTWFAAWSEGKRQFIFGYEKHSDRYFIPHGQITNRVDLPSELRGWKTDEEAFALSSSRKYPDLLYRIRTALEPPGIVHPADVLVSLKPGFASMGTSLPGGANDLAMAAFHGALDAPGTLGTLLTQEKELPDFVRSDNFMEWFPKFRAHLKNRDVPYHEGDPGASLDYGKRQTR